MRKPGTVSQGKASVIWRASHSAVGLVVTPIHRRRRRPSPKMTNTNSRSNASVGTMRKSTDAIPSAWLRRKVFHPLKADFPRTYGARDLGVLDQSRAGRRDCEISGA